MQFIITKYIAVEADDAEDAVAKMQTGKTMSIVVNVRPPQPTPGTRAPQIMMPVPQ